MIDLGSLKFKSPLLLSSGCIEYNESVKDLIPFNSVGAVITKTVTLKESGGNPMPRTSEVHLGLLNSIGLQNKGIDYYLSNILPALEDSLNCHIISSISGSTIEEFAELASILDRERAISAIEVNISCPNLEKDSESGIGIFA
jgi:dihydroorotate dehydrogenase (NAD+) catalytic subunit